MENYKKSSYYLGGIIFFGVAVIDKIVRIEVWEYIDNIIVLLLSFCVGKFFYHYKNKQ